MRNLIHDKGNEIFPMATASNFRLCNMQATPYFADSSVYRPVHMISRSCIYMEVVS